MEQKVVDYIKTGLAQKKSKEDIYKELLLQGTTIETIQASFNAIDSAEEKEDSQQRTIRIILVIAAILIGVGIFSFVASNWQGMSKTAKIMIIFTAMCVAYGLGWYFKEKKQLLRTADALMFLGVIIYGAGIFLVGQMFNIRVGWPDGFILWMLGTIAMAYALESIAVLSIAIPLGLIAIIGHPIGIFYDFITNSIQLFTSTSLLILATIVTFVTGFMIRKRIPPEMKDIY